MRYLIVIIALLASTASAQTVLHRTNEAGVASADHTLNGPAGSFRLNVTVTDAGSPKDVSDIDTFRMDVIDTQDRYRVNQITQTTTPEVDPALGQVRFVIPALVARTYELKAIAIPASGTNDAYNIHWGYLTVTNVTSASSGSVSIDLIDIKSHSISNTGNMTVDGTLSVGNLDVSGAINAVDTSKVSLAGSVMTGALTSPAFYGAFIGNGAGITNIAGIADAVTNAGASINGVAISNGAAITVGSAANATGMILLATYDAASMVTNIVTFAGTFDLFAKHIFYFSVDQNARDGTPTAENVFVRFNNNTNALYWWSRDRGSAGSATATEEGPVVYAVAALTQGSTNGASAGEFVLHMGDSTTDWKRGHRTSICWADASPATDYDPNFYAVDVGGWMWKCADAVTNVQFYTANAAHWNRGKILHYGVTR